MFNSNAAGVNPPVRLSPGDETTRRSSILSPATEIDSMRGSDGFNRNKVRDSRKLNQGRSPMNYGTPDDQKFINPSQLKSSTTTLIGMPQEKSRRLSLYRNTESPDRDLNTISSTA